MPGILLLSLALGGCRDSQEQAVKELERRGLQATPVALQEAVKINNSGVLDFFGTAGVKAMAPAPGEPSVLHLAAERKDWPMVGRLLKFCNEELLNHAGPGNRVMLEQAILADEFPLALTLVKSGALPEKAAAGADVLLRRANRDPDLMDQLIQALPPGHEALGPALLRAVASGEKARVDQLLERKAPAGAVSAEGHGTALELACAAGQGEIAARLIQAGAKLEDSPEALAHAVERKDVPMARLLLKAGAKPDQVAKSGPEPATPLQMALASSQKDMVALMLEHGADRGICQDHAFAAGDTVLLDLLLEQGLAFDRPGPEGNPPLVRAAMEGHAALVRKLLEKGAPLDQTGALGQTAYHMAVVHNKTDAVEALLAAGMKADAPFLKPAPEALLPLFGSDYFVKWYKRDEGLTPLMLAASRGDTALMRLLLKAGAKRGTTTKSWHRFPINFACDTVNVPAAQILLGRNPEEEKVKRHAVVSLSKQRVTLFQDDKPVRSARVSTGKKSTPTPPGKYVITDKQVDWVSSIYNVPMPFFMRLSCKEIGLHAGVVPGYPASHGCIRMPRGEVQAFFKILKIGDPVTIEP